jgi:hypothetical protein
MGTLNDIVKVDGLNYPLAQYINELYAGLMRAELSNTQTITGTKQLTDADYWLQVITPSGADRTVELPVEASTNHVYLVKCASGSTYDVFVKDDSGTTTYCTLDAGKWAMFIPDGTSWNVIVVPVYTTTEIDGMKLTWNSATSISVGIGQCYAENGDFIVANSTLTASSLSLSASTWYHVYTYLSSGAPALEVVTTAPVAWKGTAYSKTGDTARRYVGSILTDGSGNVRNFVHNPITNQMLYRKFQSTATPFLVLNGGTSSTAAAVACNGVVPVTALAVHLYIVNAGDQILRMSEDNGVASGQVSYALSAGNVAVQRTVVPHVLDSSQQVWYAFAAAVGAGGAYMYVSGYLFQR